MLLENIFKYLKVSIKFFVAYSIAMFFYTVIVNTPLGGGYRWNCFEPGCTISNHDLMWNPSNKELMSGIMGDICELSLTRQYIIGRVCEPNDYTVEYYSNDIVGYFILDKINLTKSLAMNKQEFQKECKNLNISSNLKYSAPFWVVYDPYYWYVLILDMFSSEKKYVNKSKN